MRKIRIAIDGPSGAGKSTLARSAAEKLGFLYVDTGAIYRTIGYDSYLQGIDPADEAAVTARLPQLRVELRHGGDGLQHMLLDGRDVTAEIRLPEISRYASAVAAHPAVRAYLLEMQRQLAREHSVLMDGRDIGTVVQRRCLELEQRGTPEPYEKVLEDIRRRDWDDSHRAIAPLRQAEDAVVLDTTELTFAQSEEALLALIRERAGL